MHGRLRKIGWSTRKPKIGIPLVQAAKCVLSHGCIDHRDWSTMGYSCVLFNDEYHFCLESYLWRVTIWREQNIRNKPKKSGNNTVVKLKIKIFS